jgi:hypothetical protein
MVDRQTAYSPLSDPPSWFCGLFGPSGRRTKLIGVAAEAGPGDAGAVTTDAQRRSSFGADLKAVLAERDFRKLFAARLVSQTGGE